MPKKSSAMFPVGLDGRTVGQRELYMILTDWDRRGDIARVVEPVLLGMNAKWDASWMVHFKSMFINNNSSLL
jgi:hypothetical protein